MIAKRKPTLLACTQTEQQVILRLKADKDILDFSGHFTHFPLLPGVTQIDWALHYAVQHLQVPPQFKGMEVIKFQEPILPDAEVELVLSWDAAKSKLAFTYRSERNGAPVTHSSGKMKLGEASE